MYTYTRSGSIAQARIIASCHLQGLTSADAELVKRGLAGKNMRSVDFKKARKEKIRQRLVKYARQPKIGLLNDELVFKYFGSRQHVFKISQDIREKNLKGEAKYKMLVIHLVIPVKIINVGEDGLYDFIYRNKGQEVYFRGALAFRDFHKKIRKGSEVLFHFSSIISSLVNPSLRRYLLEEQGKSREFMEAVSFFKGREVNLTGIGRLIKRLVIDRYGLV